MGTRNLTAVFCDGEYKVAQYGQWDGYPSGAGVQVLEFAQSISDPYNRNEFREKVGKCRWITEEECVRRNTLIDDGKVKDWTKTWPELSRDTGCDILKMVMDSPDGMVLQNSIEFAADSLFCEWAWVIDLDKGTFEGYKGFNDRDELKEEDRFYFLKDKEREGYYGVKLVKVYPLNDLPACVTFLKDFGEDDE